MTITDVLCLHACLTCGMIVIFERTSFSPNIPILMSSIEIFPCAASMMRNSASDKELLPAPVRPTIPT